MWLVSMYFKRDAHPAQLKTLARDLKRWALVEEDAGAFWPDIDKSALRDLRTGELPKPEILNDLDFMRQGLKVAGLLDVAPPMEPWQIRLAQNQAGAADVTRRLTIIIRPFADLPVQGNEILDNLRSSLNCDPIEKIEIVEVDDPDDPDNPPSA